MPQKKYSGLQTLEKLLGGIRRRHSSNAFTYTVRSSAQLYNKWRSTIWMKVIRKQSIAIDVYHMRTCHLYKHPNIFYGAERSAQSITYHNLATPVEHPSLAGLTHSVLHWSFEVSSCQMSTMGVFNRSSFLRTSLFMVRTPESASWKNRGDFNSPQRKNGKSLNTNFWK